MTRLLDLAPRALERLRGAELVEAIRASEGRTIAAETIVATGPLLDRVSNPELVAAFGADIIVLNLYDVDRPQIAGMPRRTGDAAPDDDAAAFGAVATGAGRTAGDVARWTGRVTAVSFSRYEYGSGRLFAAARRAGSPQRLATGRASRNGLGGRLAAPCLGAAGVTGPCGATPSWPRRAACAPGGRGRDGPRDGRTRAGCSAP